MEWYRFFTVIQAALFVATIVPHVKAANASLSALKSRAVEDGAAVSQLVDAAERLLVFLAMHPERAVASGQGLGLAVALGAIQSRRGARATPMDPLTPTLRARLASFESALQAILSSLRNNPRRTELAARLLNPRLWSLTPSVQLPLARLPLPLARRQKATLWQKAEPDGAAEEPDGAAEETDAKAEAVLLELRALRPWASPTPKQSDACLAQLLLEHRCSGCIQSLDGTPASGYALTHRLLFLIVAGQVGCVDGLSVNRDVAVRRLCSVILSEAETIAALGFPELLKDLFVEQVTLCGLVGFREFLRPSWKNTILDWQRSAGCFGNFTAQMTAIRPFLILGETRGDADLGGGCLAHLTDVASAALGLHLAQFL